MGATSLGITAEDQGTEAAKQLWGPVRANQAAISKDGEESHNHASKTGKGIPSSFLSFTLGSDSRQPKQSKKPMDGICVNCCFLDRYWVFRIFFFSAWE